MKHNSFKRRITLTYKGNLRKIGIEMYPEYNMAPYVYKLNVYPDEKWIDWKDYDNISMEQNSKINKKGGKI